MKLFIILLTCSITSVLAHPEIKLHTHDGTSNTELELTNVEPSETE